MGLIDLLFPKSCYGCGQIGEYLCSNCQIKLKHLSATDGRLSLFKYHPPIKFLLSALKYDFVTDVGESLTNLCAKTIATDFPNILDYWRQNNFILCPIPLHWYRQNWRGFNQSELIASSLASQLSLKYQPDLLLRTKYTSPQVKSKNKKLRQSNISEAFSLSSASSSNIILFDDVYTTGSTLHSAASVFPKNSNIWYLTIAG